MPVPRAWAGNSPGIDQGSYTSSTGAPGIPTTPPPTVAHGKPINGVIARPPGPPLPNEQNRARLLPETEGAPVSYTVFNSFGRRRQ
jgi:hypothetical protein